MRKYRRLLLRDVSPFFGVKMYRSLHLLIILAALFPFYGDMAVPSVWAETENSNSLHKSKEVTELEKLRNDAQRWFDAQKEKRTHQFHDILELKIFQTNVFFGTTMGIFLVLAVLFIGKYLFNIARDAGAVFCEKILSLKGQDTTKVREHHFAPLMTSGALGKTKSGAMKTVGSTSKKLLFCEVMTQFVNPLVKPELIRKALTDQAGRDPKPKIGSLLIEYQVVSQQDVDKTLKLQRQYRK